MNIRIRLFFFTIESFAFHYFFILRNPAGNHSTLGFTRPVIERVASSLNLHSQRATPSLEKPQTSCGHYGPGQELCHLCSQRAKRNIPVFLHDEKRIRDETEDKLLEEYRHNRELQEQKQLEVNKEKIHLKFNLFFSFVLCLPLKKTVENQSST